MAGGIANLAFWFTANNDATDTDGADANQVAAVVIGSLATSVPLPEPRLGSRIGASWDSREWEGDRGAEWHRLNWVIDQGDAGWMVRDPDAAAGADRLGVRRAAGGRQPDGR